VTGAKWMLTIMAMRAGSDPNKRGLPQPPVSSQIGEQLFFKLWPIAAGNHRPLDDGKKVMQQL
jgi:hypothetical protein